MATFPSITPTYGTRKTNSPIVKTTQFGDGYQQRVQFGLNQNPKKFSLTWNNLTEADSDTIETFLDARADDGASFTYTPPNEPSSMQFVCPSWSKNMEFSNLATIKATFLQVFEPTS